MASLFCIYIIQEQITKKPFAALIVIQEQITKKPSAKYEGHLLS